MTSRKELKLRAKDQIRGKIGIIFLCSLLVFVIIAVSGITFVGPIILAPLLMIGMTRIFLKLSDGGTPEIKDIFSGTDVIWKALWLQILVGFFTMLWMYLLIVPGIIKALSYSMSFYVLAENPNMTAREALNESKSITKGHKGELFVLGLSFIPWFLLCTITFGIAAVYVGPYASTTVANFYKEIRQ